MQRIIGLLKKAAHPADRPSIGFPASAAGVTSVERGEFEAAIAHLSDELQALKDMEQMLLSRQHHLEQALIERGKALESEILHRRRLEERLAELEGWEQLRPLFRGAFHALNNTLAGIVTYPELALRKLPQDSPLIRPLRSIQLSGEKAVEIARDVHTLLRPKLQAKERVSLNVVVQEYLRSAEYRQLRSHFPDIEVRGTCLDIQCPVLGSSDYLTGILIHLVSAAVKTMPNGGLISLTTSHRTFDALLQEGEGIPASEYAVLEIEDQGSGLAWEMLDKVFNLPFPQNKNDFDELELSMAAVKKMVQEHHGCIEWCGHCDQRSRILLLFPLAPSQEQANPNLR